jgi:acetyl coenzyme A synthetase (ADP forming)-like protein
MPCYRPIDCLFKPKSIAVIGASTREHTVGRDIPENLLNGGYTGKLYLVNPKAESILGQPCYKNLSAIPDEVDMIVVIVNSSIVASVMEEAGQKGVKSAIIITAGFKEIGAEGKALQDKVMAIAEKYDIRVMGPNCLGVINTDSAFKMNASFAPGGMPEKGNIAFISQSGALGAAILDYAKGQHIGFSKFVSMGNKADVTETDILMYLQDDPETDVILLYVEQLSDGQKFIDICREITGGVKKAKPIIAIKSGRTAQGAKAASSHTGSLAGSDQVYNAIFAQSGVIRVDNMDEMFDYALAFSRAPLPKGNRVAIVTNAGGPGIMATDASIVNGLQLATISDEIKNDLRPKLPPTASLANPIDVIGDALADRYEVALKAVMNDDSVDGVICILTPQSTTQELETAKAIVELGKNGKKPLLSSFIGMVKTADAVRYLESNGMAHYRFPEGACRSLAKMVEFVQWGERPRTDFKKYDVDKKAALEVIMKAKTEGRSYLPEVEAFEVFKAYGFPVIRYSLCPDRDTAISVAEKIGFPVVMKIASPDIVHKVDVGGVKLNLQNKEDVGQAWNDMMAKVKEVQPDAKIWGVNIQEMLPKGGKEVILGVNRDAQFGPLMMFGLGGTYVEVFKDVTFRLAPIRELGAKRMIESIKSYKLLKGYRGEPASDVNSIADTLLRLSQLVTDIDEIAELDVNPLIVYADGKGCRVADGRILIKAK